MNNNDPLISVVMSIRNDEKNVGHAVESILNQTYSNFEFLIIDDGSTDNTHQEISKFKDNRITIYKNLNNLGLTKSLNILIKESNGKFIARQDSDDFSFKKRFEKQLDYISRYNLDACATRAIGKNTNKTIPGLSIKIPKKILIKFKNPFIHGSLMIKKSVLSELKFYDEEYYFAQDFKLISDLINNKYKVKILNENLYMLNETNNISSIYKKEQKKYAKLIIKNNRKFKNIF